MAVFDRMIESRKRFDYWNRVQGLKRSRKPGSDDAMRAARARFSGLKPLEFDPSMFVESVIEGNDLMPIRYFELGHLAARPVGRILVDLGVRGQGFATGFLVAPGLLLTNHHVLGSVEIAQASSVAFDAEDGIDGLPKPPCVFRFAPDECYFSNKKLDFCFVAVRPTSIDGRRIADFGYLRLHGGAGKILRDEYATIIQHPRGRQKQVVVRNNQIIVYVYDSELSKAESRENDHIYYSADTMPGSSGAPVFSDQWYVVALHRRGVPKTTKVGGKLLVMRKDEKPAGANDPESVIQFEANEGVRVSRILREVDRAASGKTAEAGRARDVRDRLAASLRKADLGPLQAATVGAPGVSAVAEEQGDALELVRRRLSDFADAEGFDERFLGPKVGLPLLNEELAKAAAPRTDGKSGYVLEYRHFSVVVHARRRLPVFAAVNIDGAQVNASKKPSRPKWSYDPRIAEDHQPDDSIFSDEVQRGHMAAREFMWWGDLSEAQEADRHSFTLSNVCPQIDKFNGHLEWRKVEAAIFKAAKDGGRKVNCFMGPVLADDDPLYDDLRGGRSTAARGTNIRLPRKFWYVLVWRDAAGGGRKAALRTRGFVLNQGDDIENAGALEFDFPKPETVEEASLSRIRKLTGLEFPGLD